MGGGGCVSLLVLHSLLLLRLLQQHVTCTTTCHMYNNMSHVQQHVTCTTTCHMYNNMSHVQQHVTCTTTCHMYNNMSHVQQHVTCTTCHMYICFHRLIGGGAYDYDADDSGLDLCPWSWDNAVFLIRFVFEI